MARRLLFAVAVVVLSTGAARAEPAPIDWGKLDSPYLREVVFDFRQHRFFSAIGRLLSERFRGSFKQEKTKSELMLAYAYLAYGMHADAATVLQQLAPDPLNDELRNSILLELANQRYQHGDLPGALKTGQRIAGEMSTELKQRKIVFDAVLLLRQQKYDEAVARLSTLTGQSAAAALGYFNLGTTLLRLNRRDEAEVWLRKAADTPDDDVESLALRDRANFVLGFSALRAQAAVQAKTHFQRVRIDSPFSNRALLGVGLAFEALREHKQSLAAWLELTQRNAADRAVLDGLLAAPYAYLQLGAHEQAAQQYKFALNVYDAELKNVETAVEQARSGALIGAIVEHLSQARAEAFNEYQTFPAVPEARYLGPLYQSHEFQAALRNYRDLKLMEKQLADWATTIYSMKNMSDTFIKVYVDQIAAKQTKLVTAAEEMKQYIGRLALAELERHRQMLLGYAREALFKLGQSYDRGAGP